jgi:hypothetical protein
MSNDRTDDHHSGDLYARGEGEIYDDGFHDQDNESEFQDHSHKHEPTKDQMMDQAIERKEPPKSGSPEALGVSWTEGTYSGKALRSTNILIIFVTIFFVAVGIWLMVKGSMGDHGTLYWSLLLIVPICAWVYFFVTVHE